MIEVTFEDRKRAHHIREQTLVEDIIAQMIKKWTLAGHVLWRTGDQGNRVAVQK